MEYVFSIVMTIYWSFHRKISSPQTSGVLLHVYRFLCSLFHLFAQTGAFAGPELWWCYQTVGFKTSGTG